MKNSEFRIRRGTRTGNGAGKSRRPAAFLPFLFSFLIFSGALRAQTPAPRNLVANGGFERVITFQNLYDGVDASGNVRVPRASSPVYLEGSALSSIPFAASPCFADVNGDGLPDLVIASPLGLLYWYPNIGRKGAPAFDHGRLVQTYLGPAARIHVADWNGDGKPDLIFGNVDGEVNVLLNLGSGGEPRWVQSMCKPRYMQGGDIQKGCETLQAMVGQYPLSIGNYSAPFFADWNKDGIPDLIVGEGSYSANSVRVWINQGSKSNPVFKDDARFYIAYGEGREQLSPCVYDWNGDGIPDLIVGDREGHLALYLGTAEAIKDSKKIQPLELTKFLTVGGRERVGYLISLQVCDYNEDGIPDLIYGTTSGTVMVALGKGKRGDSEFDSPTQIKGVDFVKDFKQPSSWENLVMDNAVDNGAIIDISAPMPEVLSTEDNPQIDVKEGKRALHVSWFDKFCGISKKPPGDVFKPITGEYVDGIFQIRNSTMPFILGKDYEFSFWQKGDRMRIFYTIIYHENIPNPKDPKGPPIQKDHANEYFDNVSTSSSWVEYHKTFRLLGTKGPGFDTNGRKLEDGAVITFCFVGTGDAWLDDVKLIELTR